MDFIKFHGLGNDYLVLHSDRPALSSATVRLICDRHRGVGSDGILEPIATTNADAGLRIWNPDGSLAEKSGNGLRIYARYLFDYHSFPAQFSIEVAAGVVQCQIHPENIRVEMGFASFDPSQVPCKTQLRETPVAVGDTSLALTAVGLGNPHCVVFCNAPLDSLPWRAWGAELEKHDLFPNRTNVQFALVKSPHVIDARIWERGAGETQASGSSACAIAAAAVALGLATDTIAIHMPGGSLTVSIGADFSVVLEGPVAEVGSTTLSEAFLLRCAR